MVTVPARHPAHILGDGRDLLATLCMVSEITVIERPAEDTDQPIRVEARPSEHPKCERCWNLRPDVGRDPEHPTLCGRCVRVVGALA